jgi:hypothetical protein
MKKLITILLIVFAFNGYGQISGKAGIDTTPPKIPTSVGQPKDTIPKNNEAIISIDQMNRVLAEMRKVMTIEQTEIYNELLKQMQLVINEGLMEWRKKKYKQ